MFIFECFIRIIGCRFDFYIKDVWNKLDFIVSITSLVDILMNQFLSSSTTDILKDLKILRILRIIKLAKKINGIDKLVNTI